MPRELYTQAADPNARSPAGYGGQQPHLINNGQPQFVPNQGAAIPPFQSNFMQPPSGPGTYSQFSPTPPPNFYPSPPIPTQNQVQYPPSGANDQGAPIFVEGYEQSSYQANAQPDTRFANNASPPVYNQPTDRKMDGSPQPQSPPQVYGQQRQQSSYQQPQYPQQPGYPQPQPQPYPIMQNSQPAPIQGMDVRNVLNKPRGANGDREWSHGLCDCFGDCGTCCLAWCCPCIVYSQVKTRLDHLQRNGYPHPDGGDSTGADCFVHAALSCLGGFGWILQIGSRASVRERYRIDGGGCSDCMTAWCCSPCELTQESRELELEEKALLQAGGVKR